MEKYIYQERKHLNSSWDEKKHTSYSWGENDEFINTIETEYLDYLNEKQIDYVARFWPEVFALPWSPTTESMVALSKKIEEIIRQNIQNWVSSFRLINSGRWPLFYQDSTTLIINVSRMVEGEFYDNPNMFTSRFNCWELIVEGGEVKLLTIWGKNWDEIQIKSRNVEYKHKYGVKNPNFKPSSIRKLQDNTSQITADLFSDKLNLH